jgi:hypothetical protein
VFASSPTVRMPRACLRAAASLLASLMLPAAHRPAHRSPSAGTCWPPAPGARHRPLLTRRSADRSVRARGWVESAVWVVMQVGGRRPTAGPARPPSRSTDRLGTLRRLEPAVGGLAAQPLPRRPRPGRARLRAGGAARQRQRRRPGAWDYLTVAAQSLPTARPGHAGAQPRGGPAAGDRRGPPARRAAGHAEPGPGVCGPHRGELPVRSRSGGELAERVRRAEDYATLGARVVVELHSESHATKPSTRA